MSSSAPVPPKRAPLGTRSNKAPGNLQGFEYSNKHRTSKLQPLATHHNDSENTLNRKSTISNSEKSKRVSFGLSNNEEKVRGFAEATTSTQTSAATKSTTPLQVARQPLGLRGIRQSLRETISPLPLKARKQTPARPSVGMTSLVDMTPRSLLRSELDETDELFEESLLLSPAILSKKSLAIRNVAQDVTHPLGRAADRCAEAVAKMDETSLPSAQKMERLQSDTLLQTARVHKKADEAKVIALHSKPEFAASAVAAYRAPRTTFSPLTGTNAVCMDLSGMFRDVASTTKPTPLSKFTMSLQNRLATAQKPKQSIAAPNTHTVSIKKSIPLRPKGPRLPPSESIAISDNSQEWSIKQCETFTNWLNFTIQPPDEDEELIASVDEKNRSALRCLLMHQQLAQARQRASILYKSKIMDLVRKAIGNEIAKGKMTLRKDKDLNADLTLRKQIINQLLSYSTPFLRVCLETMFGTLIDPQALIEASAIREKLGVKGTIKKGSTMSRMKVALKQFLVTKVLSDDKTLAKYTKHHCKVPSGRFGIEYQAEMQALILNRLIILFVFLDKCKEANIIDKAPKLFEDTAPVKSSRDVLLMFSREYLSAEGDFVKHLSRIGVKVSYVQNPIDELEFAVSNLATDLRDGVKLARMTEVLRKIPRTTILGSLRLPAVSRLQKLHNLGLVLHNLRAFGIPIPVDIAPHHIVDSHREIVLKLLWSVVAHCCMNDLVDFDRMRNEVTRIERLNTFRKISNSLQNVSSNPGDTLNDEQTLKSLLKRWSKAICIRFHVSVQNLSSDFADGKALCLLIHYYQPTILRQNEIKDTTRDLPSACRFLDDVVEKARANERYNISLANSRLAELGGIPKMIPACDTSAIPDEKSMLLCLAYMFSRLFEANGEVRAAVMIQRNYRRCRRIIEMQLKEAAARLIYSTWCKRKNDFYANTRLKYAHAVRVIERFVTKNGDGILRMKRNRVVGEQYCRSATILQAYIRRILAQDRYFSMLQFHHAAVLIQTRWRSFGARRRFTTMIRQSKAATIIKKAWGRISYAYKVALVDSLQRKHISDERQLRF
ncbi:hypothetical protein MPSEU_000963100 [Mayamaea pseudoterrestris]|nr:hypothetical protein MPSEU_000963100 [Mayamaea pseudoterrestris]